MKFFGRSKKTGPDPIDMGTSMKMAREVVGFSSAGSVTAQVMLDRSKELGLPTEHLYVGLGMSAETTLRLDHQVQFVICVGGCQERGALPCLSKLLELQKKRAAKGDPSFDLVPRQCLTRCQNAPVIEIRTPDGNAVLTAATPKMVADAVSELLP